METLGEGKKREGGGSRVQEAEISWQGWRWVKKKKEVEKYQSWSPKEK